MFKSEQDEGNAGDRGGVEAAAAQSLGGDLEEDHTPHTKKPLLIASAHETTAR